MYKIQPTRLSTFIHYLQRYYLVPISWQRIVRYSFPVILIFLFVLQTVYPSLFPNTGGLNYLFVFGILYLGLPFFNAFFALRNFSGKPSVISFDFGTNSVTMKGEGVDFSFQFEVIGEVFIAGKYGRISIHSKSRRNFLYLFKDEVVEGDFEKLKEDLRKIKAVLKKKI